VKKSATQRAMLRFGLRVLEEREARALTQEGLAELVELSPRQIQRVEAGEANVALELIIRIADALSVDPGQLFAPPSPGTKRRAGRPARQ
jgi:transcriptional regulator with XRE-family HTH domain